jgi:metal-dependent hydrolase (beta-lactamase superfamily II)
LIAITGEYLEKQPLIKASYISILKNQVTKNLIPDPLIKDDQAIIVNILNKGLVILTGCGHVGILNADMVIFATPIWWGGQSSLEQRMIEHLDEYTMK